MPYTLELDGTQQGMPYKFVDDAMTDTFLMFPDADFSLWNDSETDVWMNIINHGEVVGKIFEIN